MGRHRTPEEKSELGAQARAMRAAGKPRREIIAELGVGDALLSEMLHGTELPDGLRRPRAKDDYRAVAESLRAAGGTYDDIAAELGVSKSSLSLWLRDMPRPVRLRPDLQPELVAGPGDADSEPSPASDHALAPDRVQSARQLRREGFLLREIAERFAVSIKTACVWCAGLPAPERSRHGGNREHIRMMNRKRWDAELAERDRERTAVKDAAAATVGVITERELELIAVTAYWCEGYKDKPYDRRETVTFINSDPGLITVWLQYLSQHGFGVDRLRLNVAIHESADVERATRYWARVAGVDPSHFGRPMLKRHNPKTIRKNVGDAYVGCLIVRVLQGRRLYQEIAGTWRGIVDAVISADEAVAS